MATKYQSVAETVINTFSKIITRGVQYTDKDGNLKNISCSFAEKDKDVLYLLFKENRSANIMSLLPHANIIKLPTVKQENQHPKPLRKVINGKVQFMPIKVDIPLTVKFYSNLKSILWNIEEQLLTLFDVEFTPPNNFNPFGYHFQIVLNSISETLNAEYGEEDNEIQYIECEFTVKNINIYKKQTLEEVITTGLEITASGESTIT